jgi:hypothetical protein
MASAGSSHLIGRRQASDLGHGLSAHVRREVLTLTDAVISRRRVGCEVCLDIGKQYGPVAIVCPRKLHRHRLRCPSSERVHVPVHIQACEERLGCAYFAQHFVVTCVDKPGIAVPE